LLNGNQSGIIPDAANGCNLAIYPKGAPWQDSLIPKPSTLLSTLNDKVED
jgi:hypothetical protein